VRDHQLDYAERLYLSAETLERPFSQLSGGELQRIGNERSTLAALCALLTPAVFVTALRKSQLSPVLALALWRKPNLMLLDEPTSALDPEATLAAEELLTTYPCVWITHSDDQERRIATKRVRHGPLD